MSWCRYSLDNTGTSDASCHWLAPGSLASFAEDDLSDCVIFISDFFFFFLIYIKWLSVMLFTTNTLLQNSFIFRLFVQRGPWWPLSREGHGFSAWEWTLLRDWGPPPCSCSVPCVIVYSIKTSLLIRQHLVHFRTVPDSTDTHTQNTHTVGTQFAAVLQAFFLLKNGSSITPLSEKTANGSREPTNAYMLRTIMQMCAETTLVA